MQEFTVDNPTASDVPAPAQAQILIVDDEPLIRWSLRRGLQNRGLLPIEAGDVAGALRQLATDPARFKAAILDYRLPDGHDLTLLGEVRRLAPRCVVFMMTAYADGDMKTQALAMGARRVIEKPLDVIALVNLVISEINA
jgi:DNA-binding NtrC family response regulator